MLIQTSFSDTDPLRDVIHGHGHKTLLREQLMCGLQDRIFAKLTLSIPE
jgi:hypothetical protein